IERSGRADRPAAKLLGVNFALGQIAQTRIEIFARYSDVSALKKLHEYLPLPLLAADVDAARHLASTCNGVGAFFLGSLYKTGRKLSKGLVTALSCCGLTSSGIGRCSCCTSPNGRTKKARFLAPTEIVGAFLFSQTRPWKTVRSQKSRYADANLLWS